MIRFEWHQHKAALNLRKHAVSFDEASTVFNDPLARIFDDLGHSTTELREIIIGHSVIGRLIMVSFVEKELSLIRIISARQTTNKERADYEENRCRGILGDAACYFSIVKIDISAVMR